MSPSTPNGSDKSGMRMPKAQAVFLEGLALVSKIFWGPDLEFCSRLHQGDALNFVYELSGFSFFESITETSEGVRMAVGTYPDPEALFQDLEQRYITLFVSSIQGIAAPLYHSCYDDSGNTGDMGGLMGQPALDMRERLASAGLKLDESLNQMPDHLCIEIEYLFFLLREGWLHRKKGRVVEAETFAAQEMLPWVRDFQSRLGVVDEGGFYNSAALLLVDLLACIDRLECH